MVVRVEDARIEVEIDTRRAVGEVEEIESQLERARTRRMRPGIERAARLGPGRAPGAGGVLVAGAAARVAARRGTTGGIRGAVGRAGGLGLAVGVGAALPDLVNLIVNAIRTSPVILEVLADELGRRLGLPEVIRKEVNSLLGAVTENVATLEAFVKTLAESVVLAGDLLAEGKITEAGMIAIRTIVEKLTPGADRDRFPKAFAIGEEAVAVISALNSYNTAEALFRQRATGERIKTWIDNQDRGFRASGGGVSK